MAARTVSTAQLAKVFRLTSRRIQQMTDEGMPKVARGQYDLGKAMLWYVYFLQDAVKNKKTDIGEGRFAGVQQQRARSLNADADLKEMELALKRGFMISIQDYEKNLTDMVITTKARINAIAPTLAVDLMGETSRTMIQAKIEKAIAGALAHLSKIDGISNPRVGALESPRSE